MPKCFCVRFQFIRRAEGASVFSTVKSLLPILKLLTTLCFFSVQRVRAFLRRRCETTCLGGKWKILHSCENVTTTIFTYLCIDWKAPLFGPWLKIRRYVGVKIWLSCFYLFFSVEQYAGHYIVGVVLFFVVSDENWKAFWEYSSWQAASRGLGLNWFVKRVKVDENAEEWVIRAVNGNEVEFLLGLSLRTNCLLMSFKFAEVFYSGNWSFVRAHSAYILVRYCIPRVTDWFKS